SQSAFLAASQGKWELRDTGMPTFGDKPLRVTNSGAGIYILSNDPVKQRAAWELMKFLTSEHGFSIIQSGIGYLPLRTGIVNDAKYLKDWYTAHPLAKANMEQLDSLEKKPIFPGTDYLTMRDLMMKAVETATLGGADVQSTLSAAQDRVQSYI